MIFFNSREFYATAIGEKDKTSFVSTFTRQSRRDSFEPSAWWTISKRSSMPSAFRRLYVVTVHPRGEIPAGQRGQEMRSLDIRGGEGRGASRTRLFCLVLREGFPASFGLVESFFGDLVIVWHPVFFCHARQPDTTRRGFFLEVIRQALVECGEVSKGGKFHIVGVMRYVRLSD